MQHIATRFVDVFCQSAPIFISPFGAFGEKVMRYSILVGKMHRNISLLDENGSSSCSFDFFPMSIPIRSLARHLVSVYQGSRNFSDGWLAHWSNKGGGGDGVAVYALAALVCLVRNPGTRY